ncbi:MAG: hydantoinase B/oxoprolinase family protein, partial [Chloroflexi bacterium]|nr:hydantoinase B/oxoprolinase family protein [Chloroflexota bacterium]
STKDGPDAVQSHGQNTENAPVEETEANYPVRIPMVQSAREASPLRRLRQPPARSWCAAAGAARPRGSPLVRSHQPRPDRTPPSAAR